jgi:tetratricopeptide (TPR) repeat protein
MSKPSLEERLLDLLYGDLDPETAAAVEAEVKTDPVLRERLEAWRQVRHAMADLPEPQPDPQVRYAILRAARQAVEKPEKKGIFAWFTALSMSPAFAALGLAVLGGGLWFALSQGYRDSEAPPESRLEKAAVGAPPSVVQDARIAPPPTVTVAASEGLQAVPRADEGTVAVGEAEEKPLAENLLQKVAEEAPQAEPEAAKKGADGDGMAPLAAERAEAEPAEPDPARPAEPAEGGEAKTIAGDKAPEAPRARRAAPRAAEAAAAEGRSAGKALLDLATKDDRVAGDAEDRGFGGGGLTAEDAFAGAPPPADEGQAAGLREKKSKVAPSPFPAEESEAQKPQRAVAGPAERPAAPRDVVADAPVGGAAAPGDDDAEKARDLPKNQAAGVKTVDQVPAEAAPQAPVPETAQAPAPGQAVDDAPRQATVLGAAKVAKEADTDEVAADEAGAEEVAVDRPAAGAAAGAAVDGLARVPAREQPPGTPGELLEARNARRRGDHDAAVEAYQRYFAGYRSDDQVASAWLEAAQSYEALGNLASALQLYRLAARSQDPQVARTARERISAIESLRKDAARAPAEAAPAEAADTAPAEPAPAEQKP